MTLACASARACDAEHDCHACACFVARMKTMRIENIALRGEIERLERMLDAKIRAHLICDRERQEARDALARACSSSREVNDAANGVQ